jgi:hypothetical protein
MFELLPLELNEVIFSKVILWKIELNIKNITNIKLINKNIYYLIKNKAFWGKILTCLKVVVNDNYNNNYDIICFNKLIENNSLQTKIPVELLQVFNTNELLNLPFNKNKINFNQDLDESLFTEPIMRGYDNRNNFFISFRYKSDYDNIQYIEVIYKKPAHLMTILDGEKEPIWTTCGSGPYIFYSSLRNNNSNYSFLNETCIDYIKKLLVNDAGVIFDNYPYGWSEDSINKLKLI